MTMPTCDCCETLLDPADDVLCPYCLDHCLDDEDRIGFGLDAEELAIGGAPC